jgi:carbon storage regulator
MLVLSRKLNETLVIDGSIRITVVGIRGNQVRLGIEAPDRVGIYREELCLPNRAVEGSAGLSPPVGATRLSRRPLVAT